MPPTRKWAIASVDVFDAAPDPIITDRGFGMLDIIEEMYRDGEFDSRSLGRRNLTYIDGIGVTCKAFPVFSDTRLVDFAVSSTWDEVRPVTGHDRVYRLRQYDGSLGTSYSATTVYDLPENPHIGIELFLQDTPGGWVSATHGEPYVQIEIGNQAWAIIVTKSGAYLGRGVGSGLYTVVEDIGSPAPGSGWSDQQSFWIYFQPLRGKIAVSLDFGNDYAVYELPNVGDYITVPSGRLRVSGRGGIMAFGLHPLGYSSGDMVSGGQDTLVSRPVATPVITGRYDTPYGTSIVFSNASTGFRDARWRARLVPAVVMRYKSLVFYYPPALYSVALRYPFVRQTTTPASSTPWDSVLAMVTIDKPERLGDSTATIMFYQKSHIPLDLSYRRRKVRIRLGYKMSDGSNYWVTSFTGYIRSMRPRWSSEFGRVMVYVQVDNASARFRRTKWDLTDVYPLGANTPNAIGDFVLKSEGLMDEAGLDTQYRIWSGLEGNNVVPIEAGLPEDPFEVTRPRESKWETLERVFGYRNMEVGADDEGRIITVPLNYIEPGDPTYTFRPVGTGSTDIREQTIESEGGFDTSDCATAITIYADAGGGKKLVIKSSDSEAEYNTASERFMPWREHYMEEIPGTPGLGTVLSRAIAVSRDLLQDKREPVVEVPVNIDFRRRQKVTMEGYEALGIADGQEHGIVSLSHTFRAGEDLGTLRTSVGLRKRWW